MRYTVIIIFFLLPAPAAYGQTFPSSYQAVRDTVRSDSLRKDSLATLPLNKGKIEIVKRDINPRKYIILAVGMMVFLALILTTVQTWNPG
jgi:hypothetical protein